MLEGNSPPSFQINQLVSQTRLQLTTRDTAWSPGPKAPTFLM